VRVVVSVQFAKFTTSFTKLTVMAPVQLSASSTTTAGSGAGTMPLHNRFIADGLLAVGGVVSTFLMMFWLTFIALPQASVTLYVLVVVMDIFLGLFRQF
jgi:hypothetical protein